MPLFAVEEDAISIFQGCVLYSYFLKIVQNKSRQCFFYKMCKDVRDPWEIVSKQ